MKVKYTYEDIEENKAFIVFNTIEEFFNDTRGYMFKELLTLERSKITNKIIISTSYPSVITIELVKEETKNDRI